MYRYSRYLLVLTLLATLLGVAPAAAQSEPPGPPAPRPWNLAHPEQNVQIFLPLIRGPEPVSPYRVSGQVTTAEGEPIPGVTVEGSSGQQAKTDANGAYTVSATQGDFGVSAYKDGYTFEPSLIDLNVTANVTGQDFTALAASSEKVQNGGFESSTWWNLMEGAGLYPASYSTVVAHSGARSARMGIVNLADLPSSPLHSQLRSPEITIPAGATSAALRLWLYPVSTEAALRPEGLGPQSADGLPTSAFGDMTMAGDAQYVNVLNSANVVVGTLVYMRSNNQFWSLHQFDLSAYAGQTIKLEVGVYNDAANGITALYVDDVSLLVSGFAPPPPPPPDTCTNQVSNSGFEYNANWNIPYTAYPAAYSYDFAYSGLRSLRAGIPLYSYGDAYSYSDAWQNVFIPSGATNATLKVRLYPRSEESGAYRPETPEAEAERPDIDPGAQLPREGSVWDEKALAPDASDAQYILILNPNTGTIIETLLWWAPRNAAGWQYREFNLGQYAGRTIRIQFGTFNNGYGGRSVMYVDDLTVDTCGGVTPPPPPTCTERIGNGGFENNSSWYIPYTNYSAGYSTWLAHTGLRGMRTGIVYWYHNRYSYSDVRQTVTIPSGANKATLRFYAYSMTGEWPAYRPEDAPQGARVELPLASADTEALEPAIQARSAEANLAGDVQYLLVLDQWGNWIDTLVWRRSNEAYWRLFQFNLDRYIGRTIILQWGTYNDGWNGVTSMYVDDVSLQACQ